MKEAKMFPKGSEWRKWDLHVHSPLSILNNQFPKHSTGEPDWESYLKKIEASDLAVIGITDYFTIEGYKVIKEFKQNGRLKNITSIFPNIEFRLSNIVSTHSGEERRINLHVIFAEDVPPELIEEHFLHDIEFSFQGNPQDTDKQKKLKLSNLKLLGEKLLAEDNKFRTSGVSPLVLGATQAVVDHKQISDILAGDDRFKGKYLILLAADFWNEINWNTQGHLLRQVLLQKSDMVFTSNPDSVQWCLGNIPYTEGKEHFIKEFSSLKPCIHGSDAHNVDRIGYPCAKIGVVNHVCNGADCDLRFCWIKADPTFDGLRQVFFEPETRVFIGPNNPYPVKSTYTIESVEISNGIIDSSLRFSETDLVFNQDLVAITGGKGAGKTALVDLIANSYMDRTNVQDKNSFVKRVLMTDQKCNLKTVLKLKSGEQLEKVVSDKTTFAESGVSYISQGELESYLDVNSDLSKHINNLIFSSPTVINSAAKFNYLQSNDDTEEIKLQLEKQCDLIDKIEKQIRPEIVEKIRVFEKATREDLEAITEKIKSIEIGLKPEVVKDAKDKQGQLLEHKTKLDKLLRVKSEIRKAILFIDEQIPSINVIVTGINTLLEELAIPGKIDDISYDGKGVLLAKSLLIDKNIQEESIRVESVQNDIDKVNINVRDHTKLLDSKSELAVKLERLNQESVKVDGLRKILSDSIIKRKSLMADLLKRVLKQRVQYEEIIRLFSSDTAAVLSDLVFLAEVRVDYEKITKMAEEVLDNRRVILDSSSEQWELKRLFELYRLVSSCDETQIESLVNLTEELCISLKPKMKQSSVVGINDFYDLLYRNYLSVVPVVKYKNTGIDKLSLGQKATVLIKIYLAQGDKPIIIDSHDDHLDNEFIMKELVEAIREAKKHRQVIIVSNNGNVVVNSDAEQVVVASRSGSGEITYLSGSLENPLIREKALSVLEGGFDAFNKRKQKYRIDR